MRIAILRKDGTRVTTEDAGTVATNKNLSYSFTCHLAPGAYRYRVFATDALGHEQIKATTAAFKVLALVPGSKGLAAATSWLTSRAGVIGYAVIDNAGRLHGYNANVQFVTASVVKAMLLVAYLRDHASLSSPATSTLTRMIEVSDNNAATAIYRVVGDAGLFRLASVAGMTRFSVSVSWARALITPADQARFFYRSGSASSPSGTEPSPATCSRTSPSRRAGASPPSRARPAGPSSSRAAGAEHRAASSYTRWRVSSAGGPRSRWP